MSLAQPYVQIELPNGNTYQAEGNVKFVDEGRSKWLFNGGQNITAWANKNLNVGDGSLKAQPFIGPGGGVRTFRVRFTQWEGNSRVWNGVADGAPAVEKMQVLGDDIADTRIDSDFPATLSFGEASTAGSLSPYTVVVGEKQLPFDSTDDASSFTGSIEFLEALGLGQAVHDLNPFTGVL